MSKWYEVKLTRVAVFVVEVEDGEGQDEAMTYAIDEFGECDESECSDQITDTAYLDSCKRHADEVLPVK